MEEAKKVSLRKTRPVTEESEEEKTIKQLDNKRKTLFNKENKSSQEKIEYSELNKTVKKMRRNKARRKRREKVQRILEAGRGPKLANKNAPKKKISCMYKSNGEITSDREEILFFFTIQ